MANEPGKTQTQAKPQMIPLSKIHELPGVFNPKPQDKSLGSMVPPKYRQQSKWRKAHMPPAIGLI